MISKERSNLNGLVLAGGRSTRMGADKGAMQWRGKEQRYYMADLLQPLCDDVFISCRPEQESEIDRAYRTLADKYEGMGPFGAILTAFPAQPYAAWLVIACDLPLMDLATLHYLVANRDATALATTFESPYDGKPEPLITIWEPKAYPVMQEMVAESISCPRKVLMRYLEQVNIIKAPNPDALMNANTPEDSEKVKQLLQYVK